MCEGEFESLKAIYAVAPDFVPKPHAWGKYEKTDAEDRDTYFLLAEFRDVGQQPVSSAGSSNNAINAIHPLGSTIIVR